MIEPRSIPKTSSGKIQRFASRAAFLADQLPVVFQWRQEEPDENGEDGAVQQPRSGLVWDYASTRSPVRSAGSPNEDDGMTAAEIRGSHEHAEPIAVIGSAAAFREPTTWKHCGGCCAMGETQSRKCRPIGGMWMHCTIRSPALRAR